MRNSTTDSKEHEDEAFTYLTYDGNAREAFTFYQQVLGGTLELMTFAQAPDAEQFPAEYRERIMHACLNLGDTR